MADGDIMGMLSSLFGGGGSPASSTTPDPSAGAPMQILPQVQQDAMAQPSLMDLIKANMAKNGPQAFSQAAQSFAPKPPAPVAPLPPIQFGQVKPPQPAPAYGSLFPTVRW